MHSVEKSTHGVFGLLPKTHPKRDKIREFLAVLVLESVEKVEKSEKLYRGLLFRGKRGAFRVMDKRWKDFFVLCKTFQDVLFVERVEK